MLDDQFDNDPNNSYFDDEFREDGGYNHFELRNYEPSVGHDLILNIEWTILLKGEQMPSLI